MLGLANILVYHHLPKNKSSLWPLTKKHAELKNSYIVDCLQFCNHSEFYDDFSILREQSVFTKIERKPINNER